MKRRLAITLKPFWAWAVLNGGKRIENRSWSTKHRGEILIHAGSRKDAGDARALQKILKTTNLPDFADLDRGVVIAKAQLVGVVAPGKRTYLDARDNKIKPFPQSQRRWRVPKHYVFVLADVVAVYPVKATGRLKLFDPGPIRIRVRGR